MTVDSPLPFWAIPINDEIDDSSIAQQIIEKIADILPSYERLGANLDVLKFADDGRNRTARRGKLKQLKKLGRQAKNLRATFSDTDGSLIDYVAISGSLLSAVSIDLNTGSTVRSEEVPSLMETKRIMDDFVVDLRNFENLIKNATNHLGAKPGNPSDGLRDLLIRRVAHVFARNAPEVPLSHITSSLYYRVTVEYLAENAVDEGNLSRRILQLFPGATFRL